MHPFSPRGKMIRFGLEALDVARNLVDVSSRHESESSAVVLRDRIYRIAFDESTRHALHRTHVEHPALARWLSTDDVHDLLGVPSSYGGLVMTNGCGTMHVPTYLRGLFRACESRANEIGGCVEWRTVRMGPPTLTTTSTSTKDGDEQMIADDRREDPTREIEEGGTTTTSAASSATFGPRHASWDDASAMNMHLDGYDAVILCAGAGILSDRLLGDNGRRLPVQLVRGQSIEMTLPPITTTATGADDRIDDGIPHEALLCGKYVCPLPSNVRFDSSSSSSSRRFVVGATHEYKNEPLNAEEVVHEMKSRTYDMARSLWDRGSIDGLTSGVRLQAHRGRHGRMPIVGRCRNDDDYDVAGRAYGVRHRNSWIFTGLSSRGLIYHGLFGSWLARAVLHDDEEELRDECADFDWWRTRGA